ncbi:hypothetical protein GWI33_017796 [Rhynchophorus ferrugineus]|uniref:Uncharacterized protein n=1 Tax=Rhynchophorus ferrugineus TaxID=354439 RepID=A0A834M237_RHYFE|nr:hypothetical protein GWI33_017796 [Rhynchophorus ferrugineus]
MVYDEPLRLPGELLVKNAKEVDNSVEFVRNLRKQFELLRPVEGTRHGDSKIFVFKDLATATHVFVRHDSPKTPLQMPYDGPLKPAYHINENLLISPTTETISKTGSISQSVPGGISIINPGRNDDKPRTVEQMGHYAFRIIARMSFL